MRSYIEDGELIEGQEMPPVTVSEVNGRISALIESEPDLAGICVLGEVSDLRRYDSGHWYFSLKDDKSQIKAVMWRSSAAKQAMSGFIPESGMLVVADGDIRVYEANGVYQIVVQAMRPAGEGAQYAAFLKLKKKLADEGLMDQSRKLPVPSFVSEVALVTSASSAAAKDFIKVARARWKGVRITIVPAIMQGNSAPASIIGALKQADGIQSADLVAVVRGGGSSEDLWCFNDEGLARAISSMKKPVVTGIGHEIDITIADYVADLRASTPSNAAELTIPDGAAIGLALAGVSRRLRSRMEDEISVRKASLSALSMKGPMARPMDMIEIRRQAMDDFSYSLRSSMISIVEKAKAALDSRRVSVEALNPDAILRRGYSVCTLPDGSVVRDSRQAKSGALVGVRLHKGFLGCTVRESDPS